MCSLVSRTLLLQDLFLLHSSIALFLSLVLSLSLLLSRALSLSFRHPLTHSLDLTDSSLSLFLIPPCFLSVTLLLLFLSRTHSHADRMNRSRAQLLNSRTTSSQRTIKNMGEPSPVPPQPCAHNSHITRTDHAGTPYIGY